MKKRTMLALLACLPQAGAAKVDMASLPAYVRPLNGVSLCMEPMVFFSEDDVIAYPDRDLITKKIEEKFAAYRLSPVCDPFPSGQIGWTKVIIDIGKGVDNMRPFVVRIEVQSLDLRRSDNKQLTYFTVYSNFNYGVVRAFTTEFWKERILGAADDVITTFAADFAKANP